MCFKILSDFDGVWTNPVHEAQSVRDLMVAETARCVGVEPGGVARDFESFSQLAFAEPATHGWAPKEFAAGRVTAFVDEDPFCAGNALASVLGAVALGGYDVSDAGLRDRAVSYSEAILQGGFGVGFQNTEDFADHAFLAATSAYRRDRPHALVDGAADIAGALLDAGCELVVASNSETGKLLDWFSAVGIPCHDADRPAPAGRSIAARGSAGKFVLGPSSEVLEVADRRIFLDRPKYRRVLEAESADLVIGDVFSLDLALPSAMRAAGEACAPRELVLVRHPYSPAWSAVERAGGRIDHVIDRLSELPAIAARLASATH